MAIWRQFRCNFLSKIFLSRPQVVEEERNKKDGFQFFIKQNFEHQMFCNSKYNSSNKNLLLRLQNTFASAINKNISLPRYMLLVTDSEMIDFLQYSDVGMSQILGEWITWLVNEFKKLINARKDQLPTRAERDREPCLYWCLAPLHCNFGDNDARKKFNFCVESILKDQPDFRVIKIKEKWSYSDVMLVNSLGQFTEAGLYAYWEAVDCAFQFNVTRHELYLAKSKCNQKQSEPQGKDSLQKKHDKSQVHNEVNHEDSARCYHHPDEMERFFDRHRPSSAQYSRFHWNGCQQRHDSRFLLLRLNRC